DEGRRLDLNVGDLRVGDKDGGRRPGQTDQRALIDLERDPPAVGRDLSAPAARCGRRKRIGGLGGRGERQYQNRSGETEEQQKTDRGPRDAFAIFKVNTTSLFRAIG